MAKDKKIQKIVMISFAFALNLGSAGLFQQLVFADDADQQRLLQIAQNQEFGLVAFIHSGCGSCTRQLSVLEPFLKQTHWYPYLLVELNQNAVRGQDQYVKNLALAAEYGVTMFPELWLVQREKFRGQVGYGFTPIDVLSHAILETHKQWVAVSDAKKK